jgi:hypothetical protein
MTKTAAAKAADRQLQNSGVGELDTVPIAPAAQAKRA